MSKLEERQFGEIEVRPPKAFTWLAQLIFTAYGLLLFMPALLSMLIVSSIPLGIWTFALPLIALAFAVFLLPFGFGNPHALRLAHRVKPTLNPASNPLLVQVTFAPRLRSGLRAVIEDADDLGWVYCSDSALHFYGDSVALRIPFGQIMAVRRENAGLRGLFLYSITCVEFSGITAAQKLWLAERSSYFLPASRAANRDLFLAVSSTIASAKRTATAG